MRKPRNRTQKQVPPAILALYGQYQQAKSLLRMAEEADIPFDELYSMFVLNGLRVKNSDRYWWEHSVQGQSFEEIAKKNSCSTRAVRQALRSGYYPVGEKEPARVAGKKRFFTASKRLKEAWLAIGAPGLREGLMELAKNPDLVAFESIGEKEEEATIYTSKLSDDDMALIDKVDELTRERHDRSENRSLIVRQALEYTILSKGLEQFKKPEGWKSKPFNLAFGGKNPVQSLGDGRVTTFVLPIWIERQVRPLVTEKGITAHDKSKPNLSRFIRQAIQEAELDDLYLQGFSTPVGYHTSSKPIPIVLGESDREKIAQVREFLDCSVSEAIAACVSLRFPAPGDKYLDEVIAAGGTKKAALELKISEQELLDDLLKKEFLKLPPAGEGKKAKSSKKEPLPTA